MNKENSKGAAGLRRSAIAERIRLREEWSALKEVDSQPLANQNRNVKKGQRGPDSMFLRPVVPKCGQISTIPSNCVLRGVVSLVEVGAESRALPLRAALAALGASVLPAWSPLVTHLIWAQGGCRSTRARARALASFVVSPLWVEACASAERRLPERTFPAASRPSDLPSPRTLRRLLKKAEMENIPIADLLSDSPDKEQKMPRLRISSETDTSTDRSHDTSHDTSRDTTRDTSCDKTKTNDTTDIESRVNTAPRRALPKVSESLSPTPRPIKSKRKLFTQKEDEMLSDNEEKQNKKKSTKPGTQVTSQHGRRELARAERLAKKILAECRGHAQATTTVDKNRFRIVLTGMAGEERRATSLAVRSLKGRVQGEVDARTTHVLLGSCVRREDIGCPREPVAPRPRTVKALAGAARGARVLYGTWAVDSAARGHWLHHNEYEVPHLKKLSQKARVERSAIAMQRSEYAYDVFNGMRVSVSDTADNRDAAIELLNLCGAVVVSEGTGVNHGGNGVNNGGTQLKNGGTQLNNGRNQLNKGGRQLKNGGTGLNHGGTQINRTQVNLAGTQLKNGGTQLNLAGTQLNFAGTQLNNGGTQLNKGRNQLNNGGSQLKNGGTQLNLDRTQLNHGGTQQNNGGTQPNNGGKQVNNGGTQLNHGGTQLNHGGTQLNRSKMQRIGTQELQPEFQSDYDVRIGDRNGEISSKWVFDSVAATRMRTTRRYVVTAWSVEDEMNQIFAG